MPKNPRASFGSIPTLLMTTTLAVAGCGAPALEVQPHPAQLRAMTFNIQSGHRGLEGIAKVIREVGPDVVALEEVDRFSTRAAGLDQAAALSEATGLPYHQHFRATDYYGGAYGVALLSRYPIANARQIFLPNRGDQEPRTAGIATVDVGGTAVTIYVTHLSHMPTNASLRAEQSRRILEDLAGVPGPKLLMGDLNDGAGSEAVRILEGSLHDAFAAAGEGPDGTYPLPLFLPALRIDWVMASAELTPVHSFVVHSDASDHYPVVAEFSIEAQQVAASAPAALKAVP